ncbi:MAG TPA: helix-turn-helix domain-containing protein [Gammaproteobacteria bacterium]|nr:helix-turn-helix domain-containing protein [Gammaproteobacteria bacterium]
MSAARFLRQARRKAGLSQRALAERTGVPQPQIARIESGAVSPRLHTLDRLLSATGSALELAPRIGSGVDRSLIRAALRRSPEERVLAAGAAGRNLAAYLRAAGRGSRG